MFAQRKEIGAILSAAGAASWVAGTCLSVADAHAYARDPLDLRRIGPLAALIAEREAAQLIEEQAPLRERFSVDFVKPDGYDGDVPPPTTDEDDEGFDIEVSGKRKGLPIANQRNIVLALRKLGVSVRYNEFADHELIDGLPGFGPRLDDAAMNRLRLLIDERFQFRPDKDFFYDVIADRARGNTFHPVREYLAAQKWDGKERLSNWLAVYAKAADTDYVRAVGRMVLLAAVRRVLRPGAKFDEMLVLESAQGTDKSSALRALAIRDEWFTDDLPLGADTKRLMEATAGKWIVEAGELKGMSRGDVAALKAYLSRQVDEARMSYGRKVTIAHRQFVIIGTTNEVEGYLKDSTGNRRFWPVRIQRFDVDRLRADRDQLWAEAAHFEARGESIRLDPKLYPLATEEQDARRLDDPITVALHEALGDHTGKVRIIDIWKILGVDPGKTTQDQMQRVGAAMRELGWERKQRRFGGAPEWAYVKGTPDERETEIQIERVSGEIEVTKADRRNPVPPRNWGPT